MFFLLSPYVIVFILYLLVICIDFRWYLMPEDFVKGHFLFNYLSWFLGSLWQKLPFLSFSLFFPFSQTASEDDFLEDEWLKPLFP